MNEDARLGAKEEDDDKYGYPQKLRESMCRL